VLFRESRLTLVLQALSVSVLFAALSVVQTSLLTREIRFRRLAIVELAGSLAGGILGISLALRGYDAVSRSLLCSISMLVVVLCVYWLLPEALNGQVLLSILVPTGVAVYAYARWLFNRDSIIELVRLARRA
jgi:Polysaccharide biosynthesis protein